MTTDPTPFPEFTVQVFKAIRQYMEIPRKKGKRWTTFYVPACLMVPWHEIDVFAESILRVLEEHGYQFKVTREDVPGFTSLYFRIETAILKSKAIVHQ